MPEFVRLAKEGKKQFPQGALPRDSKPERFGLPYPPDLRCSFLLAGRHALCIRSVANVCNVDNRIGGHRGCRGRRPHAARHHLRRQFARKRVFWSSALRWQRP